MPKSAKPPIDLTNFNTLANNGNSVGVNEDVEGNNNFSKTASQQRKSKAQRKYERDVKLSNEDVTSEPETLPSAGSRPETLREKKAKFLSMKQAAP